MKVCDIAQEIEKLAPLHLAYDFDNVGLLVGDKNQEVGRVLLCLDLDEEVVREAAQLGAQMIIGHHPIMFSPINRVTEETSEGRAIRLLIKNDISYYAAHTNLDVAKGGLNDFLAEKLGLKNTEILAPVAAAGEGIGRIGTLDKEVTLAEFIDTVKSALSAEGVRYFGDGSAKIKKAAINTGGGASLIPDAILSGADVFVTGDFKYNQVRDCAAAGLNIIDVCHYDSEVIIEELMQKYLSAEFGDKPEIYISKANKNVMQFA